MSVPPPEDVAARWLREAGEELCAAVVIAEHAEVPDRVAGFHAHLGAEKALKSLLVLRGVEVPRSHDLVGLGRLLPEEDQDRFDAQDLELLNPWTIDGRYPADLPEGDDAELEAVLTAASRVVTAASVGHQ